MHAVRATLAAPRTVAGGFRTLITCGDNGGGGGGGAPRLLRFMTAHHLLKTYYMPLLARPLMFFRQEMSPAGMTPPPSQQHLFWITCVSDKHRDVCSRQMMSAWSCSGI